MKLSFQASHEIKYLKVKGCVRYLLNIAIKLNESAGEKKILNSSTAETGRPLKLMST